VEVSTYAADLEVCCCCSPLGLMVLLLLLFLPLQHPAPPALPRRPYPCPTASGLQAVRVRPSWLPAQQIALAGALLWLSAFQQAYGGPCLGAALPMVSGAWLMVTTSLTMTLQYSAIAMW
jgi:hypothetical protein